MALPHADPALLLPAASPTPTRLRTRYLLAKNCHRWPTWQAGRRGQQERLPSAPGSTPAPPTCRSEERRGLSVRTAEG